MRQRPANPIAISDDPSNKSAGYAENYFGTRLAVLELSQSVWENLPNRIRDPRVSGVAIDAMEAKNSPGSGELERLAQFFPDGTRVKMPVQVMLLPQGSSEAMPTVLEYGTSREVIFRSVLPVEFGDRLRLTNKDRSLDAEAEVTAVQIGASETLVAARFTAEIPNWIIKS